MELSNIFLLVEKNYKLLVNNLMIFFHSLSSKGRPRFLLLSIQNILTTDDYLFPGSKFTTRVNKKKRIFLLS